MNPHPVFYVTVFPSSGAEIDATDRVLTLAYDDDEAKADKLTLTVDNFDLSNFDSPAWKTGNMVEVSWGYPGNMAPPRRCTIQKITGSLVLSVEALSPSVLMNKTQKVRTFDKMKRSDVARQIAEENGYGVELQFIDDTEIILEHITQARMTDAQLLRDMARREGFEFYVDFDGLHFHKRKLGQKPVRRFTYYTDPGQGDIVTWTIENDIYARKAGGVQAKGIDPLKKTPIDAKADNASAKGQTALAPVKTIYTGISARDGAVTGDFEKTSGSSAVGPTTAKTQAEAQRHVDGVYAKNQMTAAELSMECRGDPQLVAKTIVEIVGIGKIVSGNYYVKNVTHKVGAGYTMTVKARRSGHLGVPGGASTGVPAKGPQNTAPAPTASTDPADPLGIGSGSWSTDPLGIGAGPWALTPKIDPRDGSVSYVEAAGRTQDDAPAPHAQPPVAAPADPLGLANGSWSEDAEADGTAPADPLGIGTFGGDT